MGILDMLASIPTASNLALKLKEAEAEVKRLKERVAELEGENATLQKTTADLTAQVGVLTQRVHGAPGADVADAGALSRAHEQVLDLLFERPRSVEELRSTLGIQAEEATYYLNDLGARAMVTQPAPYSSGPERWHIAQDGRTNVIQRRAA